MKTRLSYTSVVATLALFLAIGGTTAVGAQALLTGKSVKDESLTGADIQNDSLTGADIREGSLGSNAFSAVARANLRGATGDTGAMGPAGPAGAAGAQGPAGKGVTVTTSTGPDVAGYHDLDPLAVSTLPGAGDYVIFGRVTAHNTGGSDDGFQCGLFSDDGQSGGGGTNVIAGDSATVSVVGAISATHGGDVTLKCQGSGATTFDLSGITLRLHDLG
jgi:hypothetical protein